MEQCTAKQMKSIRAQEASEQVTLDTRQSHGCETPLSNSDFQEDHLSTPDKTPAQSYLEGVASPGSATTRSLDGIKDWIENGVDGEKDGQWSQAGRAIPGAMAMGGAMMFGRSIDTITGLLGIDPFGD